ncbi:hypothetical protein [Shewanella xiamenensis]|uniref:hypothetical protein n=1 Tax=Shewanella xiamenensis TaxID=332186 RepID=UPI00313CD58C
MKVTVGGMDAAIEPIGTYSRRVTEMAVLNQYTPALKNGTVSIKNPRITGISKLSKTAKTN